MKLYRIKLSNRLLKGFILKRYKEIIIVLVNGKFYAVARKAIKSITEEANANEGDQSID